MVFLLNPPVEDAAGGEADKSLRLPCLLERSVNPVIGAPYVGTIVLG